MATKIIAGSCGVALRKVSRCGATMAFIVALAALPGTALAIPLTGLTVWLNADTLAGPDGTPIASWTDVSGNNHHAVAFTPLNPANQPTLRNGIYNGHDAVRFTSSTALRNATIPSINDMTVFAVYKWNFLSTQNWYLSFGFEDPEFGVGSQSTNLTVYDNGYRIYGTLLQNTTNLYRTTFVRSGGNQNKMTFENGMTETVAFPYVATGTTYQLGTQSFGTINGTANIDLAEIIIYSGALSSGDQQEVLDYLFQKFDPTFVPVPEPSTLTLLVLGGAALTIRRRRRK